jgi:two-component system response regulator NreC
MADNFFAHPLHQELKIMNILLIDEQPVIHEGLSSFLKDYDDISITDYTSSVVDALKLLKQNVYDLVLMDLAIPEMSGEEAIRLICEENSELAIIIYSNRKDEAFVYQALNAGARGYLLKNTPMEELVFAVRSINMQKYILSPDLNPDIIDFYLENRNLEDDYLGDYESLTQREKQVFRLLANGEETQAIAEALFISEKTVAKHRSAIKKKLSLNNPVEMSHYAMRIGILDQEDFDKKPEQII